MRNIYRLAAFAAFLVALPALATPTTTSYDFNSAATASTASASAASVSGGGVYTSFGDAASYNGLYNSTYFGNSATYAGAGGTGLSTTVTAWASTGTGTTPGAAAQGSAGSGVNSGMATTMAAGTLQNAVLTAYQVANGGTGAYSGSGYALAETSRNTNGGNSPGNHDFACDTSTCSPDVPAHAVDNNGAYESLLFSFSKAVTLSSVTLGYPGTGTQNVGTSDLTILYCVAANMANCATSTFSGQSYSALVSSGNWAYTNLLNLSSSNDTGSTGLNVKSNYWMVGAFIADLPKQVAGDGIADYVKIRAINTCTSVVCAVPEPGSLALFGIAGSALWVGRRRRQLRVA